MNIFNQEIKDGLEILIKTNSSISYASCVESSNKKNHKIANIKALASLDDSDLYYVQSILVSSDWNKNDDIFDKSEVWAAKSTPEDKPTNLNHDENIIIGHITSCWPITEDSILIDKDTPLENLPNKFHILTGSVIYKSYTQEDLKERTEALIKEIEDGTKYVSMECFFNGFDYGLINKATNEYKILARNEANAYLTKFLRAYGGDGEHDNYKIGRVLRNITFSGKGYVDRPANPDSIIFNTPIFDEKKSSGNNKSIFLEKDMFFDNSGVIDNQSISQNLETLQMNEDINKESKVELKQQTTSASADVVYSKEASDTIQAKITSLTSANLEMEEEISQAAKKTKDQMKKMKEEMDKMSDDSEAAIKAMRLELDAANSIIETYRVAEATMIKKVKNMLRKASLVDKGLDSEAAAGVVEKFESLDDIAFDAMASLFAGFMPPWLMKKDDKKKDEKKKASEDISEALETAELDEEAISLSVGSNEETQVESTRAALIDFVYSRLGKKFNKGE